MSKVQPTQRQKRILERQMEADRELMEGAVDYLVFRPEIEGEFEIDELLAGDAGMFSFRPSEPMPGGKWVAVVDIGRSLMGHSEASSYRVRVPCPPPLGGPVREYIRERILEMLAGSLAGSQTDISCMSLTEEGVQETKIRFKGKPCGFGH